MYNMLQIKCNFCNRERVFNKCLVLKQIKILETIIKVVTSYIELKSDRLFI